MRHTGCAFFLTGPPKRTCVPLRLAQDHGKPLHGTVSEEIRALPPTPANIAKATITIPAGFRQVQDTLFGGPMTQFFGGPKRFAEPRLLPGLR